MSFRLLQQWQPFIAASILVILWLWETSFPFFIRKSRVRHGFRNLITAAINGAIIAVLFAGVTVYVSLYTNEKNLGLLNILNINGVEKIALSLLIFDIWNYWWHRLNHKIKFFWRFHRVHHSDPEMDVTTAARFHAGEIIFSSLIRLILIPLLGIEIWVLILYDILLLSNTMLHHANISFLPKTDKVIRYFIVTPFMHKVHHSRVKDETDSNYSSLLSIWDRIFKSYKEKENYSEIKFGLENFDEDQKQNIIGLIKTPFIRL